MQLREPAKFYAGLRVAALFGRRLSQSQVNGCATILEAASSVGWPIAFTAYGLATAFHETARTMQPVKEIGGDAYFHRMYDIEGDRPAVARQLGNLNPGDGARFPGMGYVQCTGRANAMRVQVELGERVVDCPELLMQPDIAARVMVLGMTEGWFTGRKLADLLSGRVASRAQFAAARRIINGRDRADAIADYALAFQDALVVGGWGA